MATPIRVGMVTDQPITPRIAMEFQFHLPRACSMRLCLEAPSRIMRSAEGESWMCESGSGILFRLQYVPHQIAFQLGLQGSGLLLQFLAFAELLLDVLF